MLDFVGKRKYFITLSAVLIIISLILVFTKNFEYGIDFSGGTEITMSMTEKVSIDELRNELKAFDETYATAKIVELKPMTGMEDKALYAVTINKSFVEGESELQQSFKDNFAASFKAHNAEIIQFNQISGAAAEEIKEYAWYAVLISLVLLLAYISLRFKFSFGVGALIALAHDIIITMGFYSLFGIEINVTAIAALLTLAGYSLNDTIVVYDRIRDNLKKMRGLSVAEIVNKSINEVIFRSINTSITTFVVALLMMIMGGKEIMSFSFGLSIGIIVGTYSSLYIASPIVIKWLEGKRAKAK